MSDTTNGDNTTPINDGGQPSQKMRKSTETTTPTKKKTPYRRETVTVSPGSKLGAESRFQRRKMKRSESGQRALDFYYQQKECEERWYHSDDYEVGKGNVSQEDMNTLLESLPESVLETLKGDRAIAKKIAQCKRIPSAAIERALGLKAGFVDGIIRKDTSTYKSKLATQDATHKTIGSPEERVHLHQIIRNAHDHGVPLTRLECAKLMFDVLQQRKEEHKGMNVREKAFCENPKLGQTWWTNFSAEFELTTKDPRKLCKARLLAYTEGTVELWFDVLTEALADIGWVGENGEFKYPSRILNMDESPCLKYETMTSKCVAPKGEPAQVACKEKHRRRTLAATVSLAGELLPPLIIDESNKQTTSNQNGRLRTYTHKVGEDTYKYWKAGTKTSIINHHVLTCYLRSLRRYWDEKEGTTKGEQLVLIVDGHTTRLHKTVIRAAIQNNILMILLYPNTTHALQPLDQMFNSYHQNMLSNCEGRVLTKAAAEKMNVLTYYNWTEGNVTTAWEKVGITEKGCDQQLLAHTPRKGKPPHIEDKPEVDEIDNAEDANKAMDIMLEKCRRGDDFEPDKQRLVAFHNRMSGDNRTEYYRKIRHRYKGVEEKSAKSKQYELKAMGPLVEKNIYLRAEIRVIIAQEMNNARRNHDTEVKYTNQLGVLIKGELIANEIDLISEDLRDAMRARNLVVSTKTKTEMILELALHLDKNATFTESLPPHEPKSRKRKCKYSTDNTPPTAPPTATTTATTSSSSTSTNNIAPTTTLNSATPPRIDTNFCQHDLRPSSDHTNTPDRRILAPNQPQNKSPSLTDTTNTTTHTSPTNIHNFH